MIGAAAASGFRFLIGAVVLTAVARPPLRGRDRAGWLGIAAFGVAVAFMNICFFQAVARLPLGTAVSIEFLGPFTLALIAGSGRRHAAYATVGLVGVVLLARPGGGVTVLGALFALGAAVGWASYTLASERLGAVTRGVDGLALALCLAAVLTAPFTVSEYGSLTWAVLGRHRLRGGVAGPGPARQHLGAGGRTVRRGRRHRRDERCEAPSSVAPTGVSSRGWPHGRWGRCGAGSAGTVMAGGPPR